MGRGVNINKHKAPEERRAVRTCLHAHSDLGESVCVCFFFFCMNGA
jgi:hypothetical protein